MFAAFNPPVSDLWAARHLRESELAHERKIAKIKVAAIQAAYKLDGETVRLKTPQSPCSRSAPPTGSPVTYEMPSVIALRVAPSVCLDPQAVARTPIPCLH
jgi:hypothetical protein